MPGRVDTALLGMIDFSNPDIPVEKIQKLYENDFPYLEITPEGEKHLYGKEEQPPQPQPEPIPVQEPEIIETTPEPAPKEESAEEPQKEPQETNQTAYKTTVSKKKPYKRKKTTRSKE